ncbi:ribosome silencing factor [Alphaproteobacteria bacterium]|nr:ribosome silencing factor [Alphaproteobacteria bacterium]
MKKSSLMLCKLIKKSLSKNKAKEITIIDLKKKTSIADYMIICTGTSNRHLIALSDYLNEDLKKLQLNMLNIEGKKSGDWIVVDVGDIIVHLFRSEVREYYNLEKMWSLN